MWRLTIDSIYSLFISFIYLKIRLEYEKTDLFASFPKNDSFFLTIAQFQLSNLPLKRPRTCNYSLVMSQKK